MIGLFCRISSLLQGSFAKETYHFKEPTNRSHPISLFLIPHCGILGVHMITHVCVSHSQIYTCALFLIPRLPVCEPCVYVWMCEREGDHECTYECVSARETMCIRMNVWRREFVNARESWDDKYTRAPSFWYRGATRTACVSMCTRMNTAMRYGVAMISRLLKSIGLFCKRAL